MNIKITVYCMVMLFGLVVSESQKDILMDFYQSTNGDNWGNSEGWGSGRSVCSWFGITCDDSDNIINIDLTSNQLSGPIPDSFGNLASLQVLTLWDNELSGDLPDSLQNLGNLTSFVLKTNRLTGMSESFEISSVTDCWLSVNRFSCPISSWAKKNCRAKCS